MWRGPPRQLFHVHTTLDCIKLHNQLTVEGRRHEVKIILTSHCPESPAREWADMSFSKCGDPFWLRRYLPTTALWIGWPSYSRMRYCFPARRRLSPTKSTIHGFPERPKAQAPLLSADGCGASEEERACRSQGQVRALRPLCGLLSGAAQCDQGI